MSKLKNSNRELINLQFNFLMDNSTRQALESIVELSGMNASVVLRRLILKEAKEKTLEI